MLTLRSDVVERVRERKTPLKRKCPACGGRLTQKGDCLNSGCQVYRVKGGTRGGGWIPERIVWCSRPRLKPLSQAELRSLLEPYLTPDVERLLEKV